VEGEPEIPKDFVAEFIPEDPVTKEILKQYTTGDQTLNEHIYGNIPLKVVDFKKKKFH
jgi:hypothetical protein